MRASAARRDAAARLRDAGVISPERDADLLLAHVLDVALGRLPLVDDLGGPEQKQYDALVARRAAREPLQHLTGSAAFRHVELAVGPGVFVPRPETELLAGWAIEQARVAGRVADEERVGPRVAGRVADEERVGPRVAGRVADEERVGVSRPPVVVDLCTGSGAIAKAVADEAPDAEVHAVELDEGAMAWAERNLAGTGVDLRHGDLATAFDDLLGTVDVVVCNPPYIPLEAWESVAAEARDHDPHLALFSGQDGLDAIRVLERRAAELLRPGGVVGAEHADVQGESAPGAFAATGRWADVADHRDLAGRPRYLTARLAR